MMAVGEEARRARRVSWFGILRSVELIAGRIESATFQTDSELTGPLLHNVRPLRTPLRAPDQTEGHAVRFSGHSRAAHESKVAVGAGPSRSTTLHPTDTGWASVHPDSGSIPWTVPGQTTLDFHVRSRS